MVPMGLEDRRGLERVGRVGSFGSYEADEKMPFGGRKVVEGNKKGRLRRSSMPQQVTITSEGGPVSRT